MSYTHLTELLETLDILTDTEFVTKLHQSITQAHQFAMRTEELC